MAEDNDSELMVKTGGEVQIDDEIRKSSVFMQGLQSPTVFKLTGNKNGVPTVETIPVPDYGQAWSFDWDSGPKEILVVEVNNFRWVEAPFNSRGFACIGTTHQGRNPTFYHYNRFGGPRLQDNGGM